MGMLFPSSMRKPMSLDHRMDPSDYGMLAIRNPILYLLGRMGKRTLGSVLFVPCLSLLSGSHDGHLNFWQFSKQKQQISRIHQLAIPGFINGIAAPKSGKFVVVAVGQEHRLGRWWRNKDTRNSVQIVSMPIEK